MNYKFREEIWGNNKISNEAKDFISRIFVEARKRMTAEQCLQHPWLKQTDQEKKQKIVRIREN